MYWSSFLIFFLTVGSFSAAGDEITMWTRKPGDYSLGKKLNKMAVQTINLNKVKGETRTLDDVHYQKNMTFKGVSLMDLVATYNATPNLNLALLHFKNGMIYPVRREDRKSMQKIFVAHMVKLKKGFSYKFPDSVIKEVSRGGKVREIKTSFQGVKIAVQKDWLRIGKDNRPIHGSFNPFQYADSFVGIEFAEAEAYYNQFRVKDYFKKRFDGRVVYIAHCQYCHGVKGIGAAYGRDFIGDMPVFENLEPIALFKQVKQPNRGVSADLMPHQPDFKPSEARDLWKWLRTISIERLLPYKPGAA